MRLEVSWIVILADVLVITKETVHVFVYAVKGFVCVDFEGC